MTSITNSPPRAPPSKYTAHRGTRWEKEKAAAGEAAFEYPDDPKYVGPWIIGETVGKGASGRVRIARHRHTGQLAAVKILPLQPLMHSRASLATQQAKSEKQRLGIDREITMMKLMNHPNIMRIYDVYEGEKELYLVLEYVEGGELFDFLVNRGRLHTLEALDYFKQIVYGLNYAHTFSIIHRDLKPENILIHSLDPPLIKIADWGMAAFAPPQLQLETSCGSPHYASPEIVNGSKYEGNATDIWSCGVILYALLTGRLPFDDEKVSSLLQKVKLGKYSMPSHINPVVQDLLRRMLVVDVNRRITIPEIMKHPFFRHPTPNILYVPAPPMAEIARPIRSAEFIDGDLFDSLMVIWGRNANRKELTADLLSPPGSGTFAKAFYFLLHLYRDQTMKDCEMVVDDNDVDGKIVTKQYTSPPPDKIKVDTSALRVPSHHDGPKELSRSPSPRLPPARPVSQVAPAAVEKPPRPRTSSPPVRKPRPVSSPMPTYANAGPNNNNSATGTGSERPPIKRRSSAVPSQTQKQKQNQNQAPIPIARPRAPAFLERGRPVTVYQPMQYETPPKQSTVHFPIISPRHSVGPTLSPQTIYAPPPAAAIQMAEPMAMLKAPRIANNPEFQKTIDDLTDKVNVLAARGNAVALAQAQVHAQSAGASEHGHAQALSFTNADSNVPRNRQSQAFVHAYSPANFVLPERDISDETKQWNKENKDGGRVLPIFGGVPMSGGLFERKNRIESGKEPMKKEKKGRPPTLDLHGYHYSKRSAFGSPNPASPPGMPLLSPAVGEFKGWFSNLFNWKAQTYVLCSTENIYTTRNQVVRLLEQLKVIVGLEDTDGHGQLRCRIDDIIDPTTGCAIQKQARFRVEMYTSSGNPCSGTQQNPCSSPNPSATTARYSLNKHLLSGSQCAIVLTQEKGSVSTFRAVCRRLREQWTLDVMQSPVVDSSGVERNVAMSGYAQRLMEQGEYVA